MNLIFGAANARGEAAEDGEGNAEQNHVVQLFLFESFQSCFRDLVSLRGFECIKLVKRCLVVKASHSCDKS